MSLLPKSFISKLVFPENNFFADDTLNVKVHYTTFTKEVDSIFIRVMTNQKERKQGTLKSIS